MRLLSLLKSPSSARVLSLGIPRPTYSATTISRPLTSNKPYSSSGKVSLLSRASCRTGFLSNSTAAAIHSANMATKSSAAATHDEYNRNSLFNMKGRVALVTGSGSGIGLMVAQALAVNGAKVYIVGRTVSKLQNVIEKYGRDIEGELIPLAADVTNKNDIAKLVKEIESREKCLCILVNNAGSPSAEVSTKSGSAREMKQNLFDNEKSTVEDWTGPYAANVASMFFTTAAFLPLLQASTERHHGWSGTVINISSISGMIKCAQHHFSYNASKAASIHLTRMLASEIAQNGHKIRVNSIAPGPFPSEMTAGVSDEFQKSEIPKEKFEGECPASRPGRDVDMAQAVLMLAANQFVNGQTLAVDGGYTLAAGM